MSDWDFAECRECGGTWVIRSSSTVKYCGVCAGDCGHDVRVNRRPATVEDDPEFGFNPLADAAKATHTPPPWRLGIYDWGWHLSSEEHGNRIAMERFDPECLPETHAQQKADARLMRAAPELLEMLQKSLEYLERYEDVYGVLFDGDDIDHPPTEEIKEIIAKAEYRPEVDT